MDELDELIPLPDGFASLEDGLVPLHGHQIPLADSLVLLAGHASKLIGLSVDNPILDADLLLHVANFFRLLEGHLSVAIVVSAQSENNQLELMILLAQAVNHFVFPLKFCTRLSGGCESTRLSWMNQVC